MLIKKKLTTINLVQIEMLPTWLEAKRIYIYIFEKQVTVEEADSDCSHLRAALGPTARMKSEHLNLFPDFRHSDTSGFQCKCTILMKKVKCYTFRHGIYCNFK